MIEACLHTYLSNLKDPWNDSFNFQNLLNQIKQSMSIFCVDLAFSGDF